MTDLTTRCRCCLVTINKSQNSVNIWDGIKFNKVPVAQLNNNKIKCVSKMTVITDISGKVYSRLIRTVTRLQPCCFCQYFHLSALKNASVRII